jgi:hypothetical protein
LTVEHRAASFPRKMGGGAGEGMADGDLFPPPFLVVSPEGASGQGLSWFPRRRRGFARFLSIRRLGQAANGRGSYAGMFPCDRGGWEKTGNRLRRSRAG